MAAPPAPGRRARGRALARALLVAAAVAALVAALGGGQAYWLVIPGAMLAADACRVRAGSVAGAGLVVAAGGASALRTEGAFPSPALAVLLPAACVAILLAVRERLEAEREALRLSALTDGLTGVANRRSLLMRMEYEIARHRRSRRPFGVLMLDLDGFKGLNDRFGHAAGDDLLKDVAGAIQQAVRDQDTVARMGGDEFCVLAPETDLAGAAALVERVLESVAGVTAGLDRVGASAGASAYPVDGRSAGELLDAADQRLLEVKRGRPDRRGELRRRAA